MNLFLFKNALATEKYEEVKPYITDSCCGFGFGDHIEFEGIGFLMKRYNHTKLKVNDFLNLDK